MTLFVEHLRSRGLNGNVPCSIDYEQEVVSFPVYTVWGQLAGYQNYRWKCDKTKNNDEENGRYFSWVAPNYRHCAFFGLESLSRPGPLFVVEGVWDAISVLNCGFACIALLGATPSKQMIRYINWECPPISGRFRVGLLDNDEASGKMKSVVHKSFTAEPFKDINECPRMYTPSFIYRKLALL